MKRFVTMCTAFGAGLMWTSFALAAQPQLAAPTAPQPTGTVRGTMAAYFEDAEKAEEAAADKTPKTKSRNSCGCAALLNLRAAAATSPRAAAEDRLRRAKLAAATSAAAAAALLLRELGHAVLRRQLLAVLLLLRPRRPLHAAEAPDALAATT